MTSPKEVVADMRRRVREHRRGLKTISDDELIRVHLEHLAKEYDKTDPVYSLALNEEVGGRAASSSWFWRRWRNGARYEKWVAHLSNAERLGSDQMIKGFEERDDPESREAGRLLREERESLDGRS